eukprot:2611844-Rhodomonas_salina.1
MHLISPRADRWPGGGQRGHVRREGAYVARYLRDLGVSPAPHAPPAGTTPHPPTPAVARADRAADLSTDPRRLTVPHRTQSLLPGSAGCSTSPRT